MGGSGNELETGAHGEPDAYRLSLIGVDMPADFPTGAHLAVHDAVTRAIHRTNPDAWLEFTSGWSAVAFRFRGCVRHGEAFTRSITSGESSPELRSDEEHDLFAFFTAGLSALESSAYAVHALGWAIDPDRFPMGEDDERKEATIGKTLTRLRHEHAGEPIVETLAALKSDSAFRKWRSIRNVLAHRQAPGRHISLRIGGGPDEGRSPDTWKLDDLPLDAATATSRREWLAGRLDDIVTATGAFVSAHLPEPI